MKNLIRRFATTSLIRPGQSKEIYSAICATQHGRTYNFLLKEKNSPLQTIDDLSEINQENHEELFKAIAEKKERDVKYEVPEGKDFGNKVEEKSSVATCYFSEEMWNEFLTYSNQKIIKSLKPQDGTRRDLLLNYNFCRDDNENTTYNRSLGIGLFPIITGVIHSNKFQVRPKSGFLEAEKQTFSERLDEDGYEAIKILKEYFDNAPWATNGFLKRMAMAPSLESVKKLGELLLCGVENDSEAYLTRVNNLPSSSRDPQKFAIMWENFKYVEKEFGDVAAANLLVNIGNKWSSNRVPEHQSFINAEQDYFKAIAKDLLLPIYYAKLAEDHQSRGEELPEKFMEASHVNYVSEIMAAVAEEKLTKFLTPKTLRGYANRRRDNHAKIDLEKSLLKQNEGQRPEWYAIISDQELDGYSYKVLTRQAELAMEGKEMNNCVEGFGLACRSGSRHILSGHAPDGERFMVDLMQEQDHVIAYQVRIYGDIDAPEAIKKAAKNLAAKISSGEIASSSEFGLIEEKESLVQRLGFDPFKKEERNNVAKAYQDARAVPHQFQKCSFGELMIMSGLDEGVTRAMEHIHGKPSASMMTTLWNQLSGKGREEFKVY